MSFRFTPFILAAAAVMLAAVPAFSQPAFIQGMVTDPDGKIVVGAQLAFENSDTKNRIEAKSDKKGHYITSMKARHLRRHGYGGWKTALQPEAI